jgi:putative ABC transport system permease protein
LFTLLFLTGNTMMQSVRERIPELAVLKTLGFTNLDVLTLILLEAVVLCVFAALIGLALAEFAFSFMSAVFGRVLLPTLVIVSGVAFAILLALISGSPPAWRSTRINIVDALSGK